MKDTDTGRSVDQAGICLILNGSSGKGKAQENTDRIREWAEARPGKVEIKMVGEGQTPPQLATECAKSSFGMIVVAGGDGTICAVAEALMDTGTTMGVIPSGTFNYFARSLGIPDDLQGALELLDSGEARPVTVGTINDRVFLNNASIGAYPEILDQREGIYKRWGRSRIAAHWSVIQALLTVHKPYRMKVSVDGEAHRAKTPLAFVANCAFQLDQFELDGADAIRNGEFALFLAEDCGRLKMLSFALKLARGRMKAGRDFTLYTGREIVIETSRKSGLVARDGEKEKMHSPFTFRQRTDALKVVMPRDAAP